MSLADQQWCPTSVQVTVLQARGLRIKGKSGTNDAYAVMQVGKEKYQTSVVEKSVAPVWKEEAAFDLPHVGGGGGGGGGTERTTLHVHVLHRALMGPDKQLGQAVINLLQLSEDKTRNKTEWFKLLDKTGKADKDRGEVLLDIQFMRNNMTASMFDLSAAGKSRSRLGKFKDKVRGKKKESDTVSTLAPSFTQVLTDSEDEANGDGEAAACKDGKNKKHKMKSLFSPKSNLQKNMSQSMSVLPVKNSTLSGSQSSGLNVDSSEGKKKFKFKIHKRSGSSESKDSQKQTPVEQSNMCINGSHVYCEEPPPRTSRIGSNFSLASSGHGSMEDVPENSPPSVDSLRTVRQYSPWTEEEEEEEMAEVENTKEEEEERTRMEEERRRKEEEEETVRRQQEELERLAEEKRRHEEEERRRAEEEKAKMEEEKRRREEEERVRREEERERLLEEEKQRKIEEEERQREEEARIRREEEKKRREEEERVRMEEERAQEERRRQEEERKLAEEKRRIEEERRKIEEEKVRKEEEERRRREEERAEEERRQKEEEELLRRREEEQEEKRRQEQERREKEEEEERIKETRRREEEEKANREKEEYERLMEEKRKLEEERKRIEAEERIRKEEEETIKREVERMQKEEEEEKRRLEEQEKQREEEERIRKQEQMKRGEEEERARQKREEQERLQEEKIRQEEQKRVEEEERSRKEEQERIRMEEELRQKEEERRRSEEEERVRKEEEERVRKEEEERVRKEEEERVRKEEEERIRVEEQKRQEEEEKARREKERLAEERLRLEEQEKKRKEEDERIRREERAAEARRLEKEKLTSHAEEQERENKTRDGQRAAGKKSKVSSHAEVASTNPFDENFSCNPFEEIKSSSTSGAHSTSKEAAVQQRCQSAGSSVGSKTISTDEKDLISSQREKRPAPKPPGRNQAEKPSQREQDVSTQINKQIKDKDVKTVSVLPQRSVQAIAPLSRSPTDSKNTQSLTQSDATKGTNGAAKHGKRPAPSRPRSVEEEPSSGDKKSHRGASDTKQVQVVYGLNPFEDDEDEEGEDTTGSGNSGPPHWPLAVSTDDDKDAASQAKIKSSKIARAPRPPSKSDTTSDTLTSQDAEGGQATDDTGVSVPDDAANQESDPHPEPLTVVHVQENPLQESQPVKVQNTVEVAVKKEGPPITSRRLQPVRPLNPLEQQSVSVVQEESHNKSTGLLNGTQDKTKVNNGGIKGPYSQLTQQELISLVLKQENQLSERDKKISELEQYIDNLLVRVLEERPSILMSLSAMKKAA